jgi:hypothetical protein
MHTAKASADDAVRIYVLTIAYLHDAKFDIDAVSNTMRVREMSSNLFYIWRQAQHDQPRGGVPLVARCRYFGELQAWQIELLSGETLILLDSGSVWELVSKAKLASLITKKTIRQRDRQRMPRRR